MLVKCVECGNEISWDAKTCPHCGAKNKLGKKLKRQDKNKKTLKFLGYALLVFLGFGIINSFLPEKKPTEEELKQQAEKQAAREHQRQVDKLGYAAYDIVKDMIKERLVSPSTAKFAHIGEDGVVVNVFNNDVVKILSFVDSQNKFGAIIRTKFYAHAKRDGDKVKIVDLKIIE